MARVFIGIGSNLGERRANCLRAVSELQKMGIKIIRQSSMIETEPWGVAEQPRFINMVVEAETDLTPEALLQRLKDCERRLGRTESYLWGPRLIDLDILFYNDMVIDTGELKIPHPEIPHRDFVLIPMCELAPHMRHPSLGKNMRELLHTLKGKPEGSGQ